MVLVTPQCAITRRMAALLMKNTEVLTVVRKTGACHSPRPVCEPACCREMVRQHEYCLLLRGRIRGLGLQAASQCPDLLV